MDLLEKASVILTPTAYNNGEALCVKPNDGSGDFDFSRNSAATRVNAQGLVENVQILSSNLVQNPSFSEEGVQEVSNGSFSQEGVEQISNGSFDTDSDWNKNSNWSIGGNVANCDGTSNGDINQGTTLATIGKSYKISYEVVSISQGEFFFKFGGVNGTLRNSIGVYTETIQAINTNRIALDSSNNAIGSIDNVSVREVGQDWILGTGWSIGDDKAIQDGTGNGSSVQQSNILVVGKTYKITYEILERTQGSIQVFAGFPNSNVPSNNTIGVHTHYIKAEGNTNLYLLPSNFIGSITNISVKEVGMDWVFSGGAEITGQGARINNTITGANAYINQVNSNLTIGKSLVFQYDVVQTNGKDLAIEQIGGNISLNTSTIGNNRKVYFEFDRADANLIIKRAAAATDVTITNLSVIEITDDTNLPRINYEGFSYQDALGSEEIVNGNWYSHRGADFTINDNLIYIENVGNTYGGIEQSFNVTANKIFKLTYNVIQGTTSTNWRVDIGSSQGASDLYSKGQISDFTENTTITSNSSQIWVRIYNNTPTIGDNFSIDNVSVKEYLGQSVVPNSGCGSWLFEPQSTNLVTYSEDFSTWTLGSQNVSIIPNNTISPSGLLDATKLIVGTANNGIYQPFTSLASQYTGTMYIKTATGTVDLKFGFFDGTNIDTDTITVTDTWTRFEVTKNLLASGSSRFWIYPETNGTKEVFIWGAQLEQQSYATSYIPTENNPNGVSRNQDVCTNGGSLATINSTSGTLYFEGATLVDGGSNRYISLIGGAHRISILFRGLTGRIRIDGTSFSNIEAQGIPQNNNNKIAVSYSSSGVKLFINGILEASNTDNPNFPINSLSSLDFDLNGTLPFFGKTKAIAVWKEALSDSELQSLTTI